MVKGLTNQAQLCGVHLRRAHINRMRSERGWDKRRKDEAWGSEKYMTTLFAIYTIKLYNVVLLTMQTNSPRGLMLQAHLLELVISGAAIVLGLFMWISRNDSNSDINLIAGAVLLIAGLIVFAFAMKSILKYKQ